MGYIGYYLKRDKWYGLLIILPILLLLGNGLQQTIVNFKYSCPKHLINTIFVVITLVMYPLVLFNNKKIKYTGLVISIIIMIIFGYEPLITPSTYDTKIKCSSETLIYDDTYKAYLEDKQYGELSIGYEKKIESYCINASFKKPGDTKLIIESPEGDKKVFNIHIGKMTYSFDDED